MRCTITVTLVMILQAGLCTTTSAQQQACTAEEVVRIDGLLQRSYTAGIQFAATLNMQILTNITTDTNAVLTSLTPSCRTFLERLDASMKAQQQGQQQLRPPPRLRGGGVTYDRVTDTYIGPGIACKSRGCTAF
jgi:hypothetical protein